MNARPQSSVPRPARILLAVAAVVGLIALVLRPRAPDTIIPHSPSYSAVSAPAPAPVPAAPHKPISARSNAPVPFEPATEARSPEAIETGYRAITTFRDARQRPNRS